MNFFIKALLTTSLLFYLTSAFQVPPTRIQLRSSSIPQHRHHAPLHMSSDPLVDLDDERKANLFQALLRDLQIEGVPLLGCDANQVHTLNAALWTTMAELSANPKADRACLVLEEIPLSALLAFAEDFTVLKTQDRLMTYLPELRRFSVSVVGKGLGG